MSIETVWLLFLAAAATLCAVWLLVILDFRGIFRSKVGEFIYDCTPLMFFLFVCSVCAATGLLCVGLEIVWRWTQ